MAGPQPTELGGGQLLVGVHPSVGGGGQSMVGCVHMTVIKVPPATAEVSALESTRSVAFESLRGISVPFEWLSGYECRIRQLRCSD